MPLVAVALGSNLGNRIENLQRAVDLLSADLDISLASRVYATRPMYVEDQPEFLNAAVLARTELGPLQILGLLKNAERVVGRPTRERFGPREIDLDLVAYGNLRYKHSDRIGVVLELPHSKTTERRFVLAPLFDVAPDLVLPGLGPVAELLEATERDSGSVRALEDAVLSLRRL